MGLNKALLKSKMAKYGDTQAILAKHIGLSLSRLNAKINESDGAAFSQSEMALIISHYHLTPDEATEIFFG